MAWPERSGSEASTYGVLQAGRGIAALFVVLFHLNSAIFGKPEYWERPFWSGFAVGHSGVEFFFILSGFVILRAHWRDIGRPWRLGAYLWRRFVRLYPAYWAVLALMSVAFLVLPSAIPPNAGSVGAFVSATMLIPDMSENLLVVAWTLRHEVLFYALFGLLLINRKLGVAVLVAWAGACLFYTLSYPSPTRTTIIFAHYNLLFLAGMGSYLVVRRGRLSAPGLVALLGAILFVANGMIEVALGDWSWAQRSVGYGIGSVLMIIGFCRLEEQGRIKVGRSVAFLGDASYSIYLTHFPLLALAAKVMFASGLAALVPAWAAFWLLFVCVVAAGIGFHLAVERPLLKLTKKVSRQSRATSRRGADRFGQAAWIQRLDLDG